MDRRVRVHEQQNLARGFPRRGIPGRRGAFSFHPAAQIPLALPRSQPGRRPRPGTRRPRRMSRNPGSRRPADNAKWCAAVPPKRRARRLDHGRREIGAAGEQNAMAHALSIIVQDLSTHVGQKRARFAQDDVGAGDVPVAGAGRGETNVQPAVGDLGHTQRQRRDARRGRQLDARRFGQRPDHRSWPAHQRASQRRPS